MDQPPMPQPGPQHAELKEAVGTWKVDCTYFMDPSQPPMKNVATETVTMLGDFWAIGRFEAEMMGMPFTGQATIGYEPHEKRWVSTWIDTMTPGLFVFTGQHDASGKVLEMTGEGPSPVTGGTAKYRTREEKTGPDERVFDMYVTLPDGNELQMFHYVYTRQR